VCPIPYDASFMEMFYRAWGIVQQFIAADAHLPREVALPRPPERQVARYLEDRRDFPVRAVIEVLGPLSQPELLQGETRSVGTSTVTPTAFITGGVIAPVAGVVTSDRP